MNRRVTLADVAALAGVSTATASHALRTDQSGGQGIRISQGTRARVRDAAATLHYVPSSAGRGLASGHSGRVAIVAPNLHQPYFAQMVEALGYALESAGLTSTVRLSRDANEERAAVLGTSTHDVDAVIICPHQLSPELLGSDRPPFPVVQVGGASIPFLDCVLMDEYSSFTSLMRHVLSSGRQQVAFVADRVTGTNDSPRLRAYQDAVSEAQGSVDPRLTAYGADWDRRESGVEATAGLLRSGISFDAVVAINDAVAVGALRALVSSGTRVPEDVALTGFDNTDEGAFTTPPLTTVDPRVDDMAALAVDMLRERLQGLDRPGRATTVPARLIIRGSTATRGSGPSPHGPAQPRR